MGKCLSKKPKEDFFNKPSNTDLKPNNRANDQTKKTQLAKNSASEKSLGRKDVDFDNINGGPSGLVNVT